MALDLKLSYVQRKDSKVITFTDSTGIYSVNNTGGWGAPNLETTDIDGSTHTISLQLIKRGKDNNDTTYDLIDLYTEFGPFADTTELVFAITPALIKVSGDAIGTAEDEIPDGVYEVTYYVDKGLASETSVEVTLLVDGVVRTKVYKMLANIPVVYEYDDYKSPKIDYTILAMSYLDSLEASAWLARIDDIVDTLETLDKIVLNGNNATT